MTKTYYDLGAHTRPITTSSPEAQRWFDRGLNWIYGFNHEEAAVCFERVIALDPKCAMGHWGVAYAYGPFINKQWSYYAADELVTAVTVGHDAARKALVLSSVGSAVEHALAEALTHRYQTANVVEMTTFERWNDDYAAAMRRVYLAFPQDLDVIALFVEALMMRTPWQLWDIATGEVAENAATGEMMTILAAGQQLIEESGLPPHPGLLHMHIHTMEMSPTPEAALRSADTLRGLAPDSGHLLHMPGHIYALCGHYYDAVEVSRQAIAAGDKYLQQTGPFTYYTAACCHDLHLMMRTAMFLGQIKPALEAANAITDLLSEAVLRRAKGQLAHTLEAYYSMKMHVFVRFGRWQAIIDEPLPADPVLLPITTAMARYARAIAFATLGQPAAAVREKGEFAALVESLPASHYFFNNDAHDVLAVAAAMMDGEVAYHQGRFDEAFACLRLVVARNDRLNYTEPWAWMHPPRHALGALLLAQGQIEEAEAVYRADLGFDRTIPRPLHHLNNVWSLHGYAECLERLGKTAELALIEPLLDLALARTDTPITASCCCRVDVGCC